MANIIQRIAAVFNPTLRPGGNVLDKAAIDTGTKQILDQMAVQRMEPFGTKIPKHILNRASGWSQLANLSHNFTIEKVQGALRQAEVGDVRMLFGYFRDFFIGNGMVASELGKRKLSTISEPYSILPYDKNNKQDVIAAEVIKEALDKYPNFNRSLIHLMNAIVFPISVMEKTFGPIDEKYGPNKYNLMYCIKDLHPVDYNLINYRLPYLPQGPINATIGPGVSVPPFVNSYNGRPEDTVFDPDEWCPDLRLWSVFNNGLINFSYANMMAPDPNRHIVYRCNLLDGICRENWGGLGRPILWWAIMSQMGTDKFFQCLQRYGIPYIVAKVDTSQVDTVNKVMQALEDSRVINALAVNKDAVIELQEMNMSNAAEAHEKFLQFCNDQISLLIVGQVLSSHARAQGLGSGASQLQGQVRADIIKYDRLCLDNVLRHQLFKQYLEINGIEGNCPRIVWGGSSSMEDNKNLSATILNLYNAGLEVDDNSIDDLNTQLGLQVKKMESLPAPEEQKLPVEEKPEPPKEEEPKDGPEHKKA